jgi:hypothetical protein
MLPPTREIQNGLRPALAGSHRNCRPEGAGSFHIAVANTGTGKNRVVETGLGGAGKSLRRCDLAPADVLRDSRPALAVAPLPVATFAGCKRRKNGQSFDANLRDTLAGLIRSAFPTATTRGVEVERKTSPRLDRVESGPKGKGQSRARATRPIFSPALPGGQTRPKIKMIGTPPDAHGLCPTLAGGIEITARRGLVHSAGFPLYPD